LQEQESSWRVLSSQLLGYDTDSFTEPWPNLQQPELMQNLASESVKIKVSPVLSSVTTSDPVLDGYGVIKNSFSSSTYSSWFG